MHLRCPASVSASLCSTKATNKVRRSHSRRSFYSLPPPLHHPCIANEVTGAFVAWYGSRQFLVKSLSTLESQLAGLHGGGRFAVPGSGPLDPGHPHAGIGRPHLAHDGAGASAAGSPAGARARSAASQAESDRLDLLAGSERRFEAGTGGLHELRDRYATTRGDH